MDTGTVLKIIEMLDARINVLQDIYDRTKDYVVLQCTYELTAFQIRLQKYIDSQVNQVENNINRGE